MASYGPSLAHDSRPLYCFRRRLAFELANGLLSERQRRFAGERPGAGCGYSRRGVSGRSILKSLADNYCYNYSFPDSYC